MNPSMIQLAIIGLIAFGSASIFLAFAVMRAKFMREIAVSKNREEELSRRAYETAVLKEIGDRIGYSLDAGKIVEIISHSLGSLIPYSTVSYMIFDDKREKVQFWCNVSQSVSAKFVDQVKHVMLMGATEMMQKPLMANDLDETISGNLLTGEKSSQIKSFFNLPIVISEKIVGIINVASTEENLYNDENTEVLFKIARLASNEATKLQELLESEKARLVQAVQSLADGLLMVDTKYHLVLINKKLTEMLSTVSAPSLFDIASALPGNFDLRSMVEMAVTTEEELPQKEIVVKNRTLQVVASRVLDKISQKPMGVVVLFHDITDAKSLEKLRQDFTSMMVHELRSPLTNIRSTAALVEGDIDKLKKEELVNYLENINASAFSMLEVVNDLLDVAKMESGSFDVICEDGDLASVVAERVETFRPQAENKGLKLSLDISPNLPKGYFDRVRIKQVLNNLISNAVKFTQAGEVNVKVAPEAVNENLVDIVVSVSDTGMGIDPEEGNKLFSRFGQLVRGRRSAALKGSGLGLYIAKGIVEAQGGRIWFKSEGAGLGTTFFFTVPLAGQVKKEEEHPISENLPRIRKVAQA